MESDKIFGFVLNLLVFIVGFISCFLVIYSISSSGIEKPLTGSLFSSSASSLNAPGDWVKLDQIQVNDDSIVIRVPNASLSSYAATGSMKPALDSSSNGIRIIPNSPEQINVGDIVTYGSENIVHRVIEKGTDSQGAWFLTKGDNNNVDDGEKIRFSDIKYVTIGILY